MVGNGTSELSETTKRLVLSRGEEQEALGCVLRRLVDFHDRLIWFARNGQTPKIAHSL